MFSRGRAVLPSALQREKRAAARRQMTDTHASTVVAAQVQRSCQILDLTLRPLHLDLLGLDADLNQLHLNDYCATGARESAPKPALRRRPPIG